MASIFSKIVQGEIPCYKIYEDEKVLSFLDVNPLTRGHALVITKVEIDYIFNLEDDLYQYLMKAAKLIAVAVEKAIPCKRIGMAVVGLEVPHVHIHLVPLQTVSDINFSGPTLTFSALEMEAIANSIRLNF